MPKYTSPSKYAVIIDAGSSGSRVHVFEWTDSGHLVSTMPKNSPLRGTLPAIRHKPEWSKRISPGVSGFVNDITKIWPEHLEGLMEFAESIVPEELHEKTPVFFYATAGMRLLSQPDQEKMLDTICRSLDQNSHFYLPDCKSHVAIIDGETEGLYGWLALNQLVGTLDASSKKTEVNNAKGEGKGKYTGKNERIAYGFMDMGGASAQIAFAPNSVEAEKHSDDLFKVNLRTLDGNIIDWDVYVGTWLGFGANEARTRLSQLLATNNRKEDPCLPKGLINEIPNQNNTALVNVHGTGDHDKCLEILRPLLNKHLPCPDEPCLFNGQHAPALDFETTKFVGVSEYWYTAHDIFKIGGSYDFKEYKQKAEDFCRLSWSEILENSNNGEYDQVKPHHLQNACFKISWIMTILHEGFDIPFELDYQPAPIDTSLSNDDLVRGFSGTFNSVSHINGVEMSWPLGKAILYASSQIAASSDTAHIRVGHMPMLLSGRPYVLGGETSHVLETAEKMLIPPALEGSSRAHYHLFLFMVICMVAALCFSKFRRAFIYIWRMQVSPKATLLIKKLVPSTDNDIRILEEGFSLNSIKSSQARDRLGRSYTSTSLRYEGVNGDSLGHSLGRSTSMLDLSNGGMISRESSRLGMKLERPLNSAMDGESNSSK